MGLSFFFLFFNFIYWYTIIYVYLNTHLNGYLANTHLGRQQKYTLTDISSHFLFNRYHVIYLRREDIKVNL